MAAQNNEPGKTGQRAEEHTVEIVSAPQETTAKPAVESQQDGPVLDYAGSAEKTDPAEIRLVKKLDFMMLVSG